ncbi:hypothetical protein, partial [Rhodoferax ferrireducens]|uniref:hypothetical protein n=1 Tax=Rhodoferax ferrireducens TaxID=192843 RepID=UPI001E580DCB
ARCCASAWKYLQVIENKGKNVLLTMACRILFSTQTGCAVWCCKTHLRRLSGMTHHMIGKLHLAK